MSPTLSPLSPITQAVAMDALSLEQQLPYAFFTQTGSQQPPPQPQPPPPPPPVSQQQPPPPQVSVGLPQGGPLLPSASLTRGPQLPPLSVTVPSTLPQSPTENPGQPPMGIDATSVSLEGVPGPSVCVCIHEWVGVFMSGICVFMGGVYIFMSEVCVFMSGCEFMSRGLFMIRVVWVSANCMCVHVLCF